MEPGDAYWSVVEGVWDAISIYDGEEIFLQQFEAAAEPARTLFAAHWCQSEVRNGGLSQFFWNSTGVLAPEAVNAFRELGMPELAATVAEAMQWFGVDYPRAKEPRQKALDAYEEDEGDEEDEQTPFERLDDQFFDLIETENGGFEAAADAYATSERP